ncbi:HU family DNA-binding protein [Wolbachia endosymbiont of Pentidionis agamae]
MLKDKLQNLDDDQAFRLHKIGSFYPVKLKERKYRNAQNGQTSST